MNNDPQAAPTLQETKTAPNNQHFGEHLTIDGYGGSQVLLNDKSLVLQCLEELLVKLDMHQLMDPYVVQAPDNGLKDPGGWSGFVMIAESHISLHTFPKRGFLSADVYTCKNGLDQAVVIKYLQETFQLQNVETSFILRGQDYPANNIYA
jgi:S-adenosylmethionine decarboxylase